MVKKRKVAIVTGARSEYGLIYWLMKEIDADPELELQLIVTGMHLAPEFGLTYQLIEQDGFKISAKVESQMASDTGIGVAKSVGLGIIGFADAYANLQPDIVVLHGDRFEILAAAQAALFVNIPIAHVAGGEVTTGAFDDVIRHCITKMSHLHFVSCEAYRKRVIQLGESPASVFMVGDVGVDYIARIKLLTSDVLENKLSIKFSVLNFMITYHPATFGEVSPEVGMLNLLNALDRYPNAQLIFTKANSDPGGKIINDIIDHYVQKNKNRAVAFVSLGSLNYLSCVKYVDVVIGNSSSGIVEIPYLKKPTVNIGNRQQGRLRASSIIDCENEEIAIFNAIKKALQLGPILSQSPVNSPYGDGNAAFLIKETLKDFKRTTNLAKTFCDL